MRFLSHQNPNVRGKSARFSCDDRENAVGILFNMNLKTADANFWKKSSLSISKSWNLRSEILCVWNTKIMIIPNWFICKIETNVKCWKKSKSLNSTIKKFALFSSKLGIFTVDIWHDSDVLFDENKFHESKSWFKIDAFTDKKELSWKIKVSTTILKSVDNFLINENSMNLNFCKFF